MQIEDTALEGVKLITTRRFVDNRDFFAETWNAKTFAESGIALGFVRDNHSLSETVGTVRGLHFKRLPARRQNSCAAARGGSSTWRSAFARQPDLRKMGRL
jgi:dTDP-4-dehydrorhamnose 3,5-epimerase